MDENRYGFEFEYRNRRIVGVSKRLSPEETDKISSAKWNLTDGGTGALCVRCGNCGVHMDYICKSRKWVCPVCGVGVMERTIWKQINREVELCDEILSGLDDEDDSDE